MITKLKILESLGRMRDDATIEDAIEWLTVMRKVEIGLKHMEQGKFIDHDELFDELLNDETESKTAMDRAGKTRRPRDQGSNRSRPYRQWPRITFDG